MGAKYDNYAAEVENVKTQLIGMVRAEAGAGRLTAQQVQGFNQVLGANVPVPAGNANAGNVQGGYNTTPPRAAADTGRAVTITMNVRGGAVPQGAEQRVEPALAEVARGAGLTVVPGSVRIS